MAVNKAKTLKSTSDAVTILHRRTYEGKPARMKNLEEARANEQIARKIQELRAAAALSRHAAAGERRQVRVRVPHESEDERLRFHRLRAEVKR